MLLFSKRRLAHGTLGTADPFTAAGNLQARCSDGAGCISREEGRGCIAFPLSYNNKRCPITEVRANRKYGDSLVSCAKVMSEGVAEHQLYIVPLVLIQVVTFIRSTEGVDNGRVTGPRFQPCN